MLLVSELLENYLEGATCEVEIVITYEDDDYIEREFIKGVDSKLNEDEWDREYRRRKNDLRKYRDERVLYFKVIFKKDIKTLSITIER